MEIRAAAILCSARPHGEVGVIMRVLTAEHGLVGAYVAGGRGRELRPVLIPGNGLAVELRARSASQMLSARVELAQSRAPFMAEALPAAAIGWVTALTAVALPERAAYPALYMALGALLDAVCHAPSARGWAPGMLAYERLLLRELGYGGALGWAGSADNSPAAQDWPTFLASFDRLGLALERYVLAHKRNDVMGARQRLREKLVRIGGNQPVDAGARYSD